MTFKQRLRDIFRLEVKEPAMVTPDQMVHIYSVAPPTGQSGILPSYATMQDALDAVNRLGGDIYVVDGTIYVDNEPVPSPVLDYDNMPLPPISVLPVTDPDSKENQERKLNMFNSNLNL